MKIYRLYGAKDLRMEEVPAPETGADEVLVRTEMVGLCGSDVPRILKGEVPFFPSTLGHEFSARVVELGRNVKDLAQGDLVTVVPLIVCNRCEHCRDGNFGQCLNRKFMGLRFPDSGGMAEYNVVPRQNLIQAPKGMNSSAAAFVEPVSVAMHAILSLQARPGKDVAIVGAGTIGQITVSALRAMGVRKIHVFDNQESKLKRARSLGADYIYNVGKAGYFEEYMENTGSFGVPYVIEAVGLESTILLSINACRVGGTVALVGLLGKSVCIPPDVLRKISFNQISMKGLWQSYSNNFPGDPWRLAVDFIKTGKINTNDMVYKIVPLDNLVRTVEEFEIPDRVTGKIMAHF